MYTCTVPASRHKRYHQLLFFWSREKSFIIFRWKHIMWNSTYDSKFATKLSANISVSGQQFYARNEQYYNMILIVSTLVTLGVARDMFVYLIFWNKTISYTIYLDDLSNSTTFDKKVSWHLLIASQLYSLVRYTYFRHDPLYESKS